VSEATVVTTAAGPVRAATRTRNRRGEGGLLRAEILQAADDLLDETGNEVTLRAVARRVGIAAPSIYNHFPDPSAILLALVQQAFVELREHLVSVRSGAGADPVEQLRAVCLAYLEFATDRPQRYRAMFGDVRSASNAVQNPQPDASTLREGPFGILVDCLSACVAAGRSTSDDPFADATVLWLGLHGLAHQRGIASAFPLPLDITARLITPLAHLVPPAATARVGHRRTKPVQPSAARL